MEFDAMIEKLKADISYDTDGFQDVTDLLDAIDKLQHNTAFYDSFDQLKFDAFKGVLKAVRLDVAGSEKFEKSKAKRKKYEASQHYVFSQIRGCHRANAKTTKECGNLITKFQKSSGMSDEEFSKAFTAWETKGQKA